MSCFSLQSNKHTRSLSEDLTCVHCMADSQFWATILSLSLPPAHFCVEAPPPPCTQRDQILSTKLRNSVAGPMFKNLCHKVLLILLAIELHSFSWVRGRPAKATFFTADFTPRWASDRQGNGGSSSTPLSFCSQAQRWEHGDEPSSPSHSLTVEAPKEAGNESLDNLLEDSHSTALDTYLPRHCHERGH